MNGPTEDSRPRVLVLRSAGTNCDEETAHAFQLAGATTERIHVGSLLRGERRLAEFDILAFPGGFSYGDDLGSGTVLANRLRSRLDDDLHAYVAAGKLVIGICNGFQVLVRLGLLPGWDDAGGSSGDAEKMASLVENSSARFEARWVRLRVDTDTCPFLSGERSGRGWTFRLPVAHKEGRFLVKDAATLERLQSGGQIALRYVDDASGATGFATAYPANPNGSTAGIAGITNPAGNVLGLMPHPERHLRRLNDPQWTRRAVREGLPPDEEVSGAGFAFFENAVRHASHRLRGAGAGAPSV
ncbi:MAG TPA: phosphoribosylformylglycinamidine synthase I [Planctomycetota bacterium]|jgi:phosphoribosylformylglycinamidine synthase I|nr:phosphoribosylformylglycinamidine synthase I [Planctomycetota bacterium]